MLDVNLKDTYKYLLEDKGANVPYDLKELITSGDIDLMNTIKKIYMGKNISDEEIKKFCETANSNKNSKLYIVALLENENIDWKPIKKFLYCGNMYPLFNRKKVDKKMMDFVLDEIASSYGQGYRADIIRNIKMSDAFIDFGCSLSKMDLKILNYAFLERINKDCESYKNIDKILERIKNNETAVSALINNTNLTDEEKERIAEDYDYKLNEIVNPPKAIKDHMYHSLTDVIFSKYNDDYFSKETEREKAVFTARNTMSRWMRDGKTFPDEYLIDFLSNYYEQGYTMNEFGITHALQKAKHPLVFSQLKHCKKTEHFISALNNPNIDGDILDVVDEGIETYFASPKLMKKQVFVKTLVQTKPEQTKIFNRNFAEKYIEEADEIVIKAILTSPFTPLDVVGKIKNTVDEIYEKEQAKEINRIIDLYIALTGTVGAFKTQTVMKEFMKCNFEVLKKHQFKKETRLDGDIWLMKENKRISHLFQSSTDLRPKDYEHIYDSIVGDSFYCLMDKDSDKTIKDVEEIARQLKFVQKRYKGNEILDDTFEKMYNKLKAVEECNRINDFTTIFEKTTDDFGNENNCLKLNMENLVRYLESDKKDSLLSYIGKTNNEFKELLFRKINESLTDKSNRVKIANEDYYYNMSKTITALITLEPLYIELATNLGYYKEEITKEKNKKEIEFEK